jgi:hypothetical protein
MKWTVGSSVRIWKTSVKTLCRSWPPPKRKKTSHSLRAKDVGAQVTVRSYAHSNRKRRNGSMPVGHLGRIALRREQCSV